MVSLLFAGITLSSFDKEVMPELLTQGLQTPEGGRLLIGMLAGFIPEWWPTSNRNTRPVWIGIRRLAFGDLKKLCGLTDGNLSRHLQVLEEANLVRLDKAFEGKRPVTACHLTAVGRQRFLDYLSVLEKVVRDATQTENERVPGSLERRNA